MTKPTGRRIGRPAGAVKRWHSDPDSQVIAITDLFLLLLPGMSLQGAIKLSILKHYHERRPIDDEAMISARSRKCRAEGWSVELFSPTPTGKGETKTPLEGFLRSETKRVRTKEKRYARDPEFQEWRRYAIATLLRLVLGPGRLQASTPPRWQEAAE